MQAGRGCRCTFSADKADEGQGVVSGSDQQDLRTEFKECDAVSARLHREDKFPEDPANKLRKTEE